VEFEPETVGLITMPGHHAIHCNGVLLGTRADSPAREFRRLPQYPESGGIAVTERPEILYIGMLAGVVADPDAL
jgi:hypothetical protein